jgi:hypothetical protein
MNTKSERPIVRHEIKTGEPARNGNSEGKCTQGRYIYIYTIVEVTIFYTTEKDKATKSVENTFSKTKPTIWLMVAAAVLWIVGLVELYRWGR